MTEPLDPTPPYLFARIELNHRGAHTCEGRWWNPNAGPRQPCPTVVACNVLRGIMAGLLIRVHAAAHDDDAVAAVARALLAGVDLDDLDPETREGWLFIARLGIEGLAAHLDPEATPEQLAAELTPQG